MSCLFWRWIDPFESGLDLLNVRQSSFIFIFWSEPFVKLALNALGFIINQGQNRAKNLLIFGLQKSWLGDLFGLEGIDEFVTDFIKVLKLYGSGFFLINLCKDLLKLIIWKVDSDIFK